MATATTDRNTERARECLEHLQCSVPGCSNLATEPGEFTYCAERHAHVWEVRYRDLNDNRTWTRVRATGEQDAIDRARARITERVPAFSSRFEVIEAEKVV